MFALICGIVLGYWYGTQQVLLTQKEVPTPQPTPTLKPTTIPTPTFTPTPITTPTITPTPMPPPEGVSGEIAYVKDGDIWIINVDRTNPRQITNDGVNISPKWSPDGKNLLWIKKASTNEDDDYGDIWMVNVDGTNKRQVTNDGLNMYLKWSPNNQYLSWIKLIDLDGEKHSVNIVRKNWETGETKELLEPFSEEKLKQSSGGWSSRNYELESFDWFPSNEGIVYLRDGVWTKDLNTGVEKQLLENYYDKEEYILNQIYIGVSVSPNGQKVRLSIAMYEWGGWGVVNIDGSGKEFPIKVLVPGYLWSPDSRYLLGGWTICGLGEGGVYLYDPEKDESIRINTLGSMGIEWFENGQFILTSLGYSDSCESIEHDLYDVAILDLQGNIVKRLTNDKERYLLLGASPDEKIVLFTDPKSGTSITGNSIWAVHVDSLVKWKVVDKFDAWDSRPVWRPQ